MAYDLQDIIKKREKGGVQFELHIPEFNVVAGELIGIVGPSGCGKSTLLDLLGLVLSSDRGKRFKLTSNRKSKELSYSILEMSPNDLSVIRREQIGYVLQTGGLLPFLTVSENILLPERLNRNRKENNLEYLAGRLGISEQLNKKINHLSGGQRQRVAIARALIHEPTIVLADEPTAAVDKLTAEEILNVFCELTQEQKTTVIMVTHDQVLAKKYCDRLFSFKLKKRDSFSTLSTLYEIK